MLVKEKSRIRLSIYHRLYEYIYIIYGSTNTGHVDLQCRSLRDILYSLFLRAELRYNRIHYDDRNNIAIHVHARRYLYITRRFLQPWPLQSVGPEQRRRCVQYDAIVKLGEFAYNNNEPRGLYTDQTIHDN